MTTKRTTSNARLHGAKRKKNGEFYTQLSDIEEELCHYAEAFRGKTVLCNCDDPRVSNFFKYFCLNFEHFGLKRVITTCYKNQNPDLFSTNASEKACYLIYDGNNGGNMPDWDKVEVLPLKGDGSFDSKECVELLKQADIVVTNPPFALFRDFLSLLISHNKQFIIIGNKNAITYKEVFPLIKTGKMWLGHRNINKDMWFILPDDAEDYEKIVDGKKFKHESAIWLTNIDYRERHKPMILGKKYTVEQYSKFDNYDAINVDKVIDIPKDYYEVMGVPITFLGSYCPEQFEILGLLQSSTEEQAGIPILREYDDFVEMRQDMSFTGSKGSKANGNPVMKGKSLKGNFLFNPITKEYCHSVYARITIRRK